MKRIAPFSVGFYLDNIKSFSPHSSDSEGTAAFRNFMAEKVGDRQTFLKKISSLKDEIQFLKKEIADRDKQMKTSDSLVQKLGELNRKLKEKEGKLAQRESEIAELKIDKEYQAYLLSL